MLANVVVLGASPKPDRYSNRAVRLLTEHGYRVIPVHPAAETIAGIDVRRRLAEIAEPVDTLTVYVSPAVSSPLQDEILRLRPERVIFNPGAENPGLRDGRSRDCVRW